MVNVMSCYMSLLHKMVKFVGFKPVKVEIDPCTIMNIWVPPSSSDDDRDDHQMMNKEEKKKKKKQALVLIHGFAGDGILTWQFQALTSSLREKYDIYIPDLIFFGGSHTDRPDRSPRFQADCLAKGLRKVGVMGKCMVVGFSYGGFVGFQMAEHYPDLVESMVVNSSPLALHESLSNKALNQIGFSSWSQYLLPSSVDGLKVMLDIASYKSWTLPNFLCKHFIKIMFNHRKERTELLEALVTKDEDVTNHHFHQTIHLLWGNEDQIFDVETANQLKEKLGGNCKLQVVKKAGHLCVLERPFAFNRCLKELLSSLADEEHVM